MQVNCNSGLVVECLLPRRFIKNKWILYLPYGETLLKYMFEIPFICTAMAETEAQEIVVDFGKICRLCLTEDGVLISLYSTDSLGETEIKSIPEKILELMAIKVSKDDGFPSWICHNCLSQVDKCSEFFDMCRSSQSTLNESYVKALTEAGVNISTLKSFWNHKICDSTLEFSDKTKQEKIEIVIENENGCCTEVPIKEECESDQEEASDGEVVNNDFESKKYICRDCAKIYSNLKEFLVHRISVHHDDLVTETERLDKGSVPGLWTCDLCNCKFQSRAAISAHLRLKHQSVDDKEPLAFGNLIYCKYCGSSFSRKQVLRHLQVVHKLSKNLELGQGNADSLDCKICYRPFTRQSSLRNHIEKYHSDSLEVIAEAENCDIVWKCSECDSLFPDEVILVQHYGEKHSKYPLETDTLRILINKNFICHCGVINSNSIDAFIHDIFYHRDEEDENCAFECLACYEIFSHVNDLKRHIITFHWFVATNYDNECAFCIKKFASHEYLRIHLRNEHDLRLSPPKEEKLFNDNCGKSEGEIVENVKVLLEEPRVEEDEKLSANVKTDEEPKISCSSCRDNFESVEDFQNHSSECKESYACELCGKIYRSGTHLKRHIIEYHNSMSPIKCPLCQKVFPRKLNLHNHYKRRHLKQTKKFMCSYCGVSLKGKVALRSHEDRLHRNIRNYKCSECPEAFTTRSILRKHAQRHLADRPMLQCHFCERKFSTISGIERHVKTHGGVKDFSCDVPMCGKSFYTKSELKRHTKFHTKDFKHVCPVCGHKFMTPGELKKHSTKHTGERPFKCHLCPCAYSRRDDKVKHLKRVHNLKVKRIYGKPLRKYTDENNDTVDTIVVDEESSAEVTPPNNVVYANISIIE